MPAWAKGHAALHPDAGFSNSRVAVAGVQRSNSMARGKNKRPYRSGSYERVMPLARFDGASTVVSGSRLSRTGREERSAPKGADLVVGRRRCRQVA